MMCCGFVMRLTIIRIAVEKEIGNRIASLLTRLIQRTARVAEDRIEYHDAEYEYHDAEYEYEYSSRHGGGNCEFVPTFSRLSPVQIDACA